jgi:hypothetical protein
MEGHRGVAAFDGGAITSDAGALLLGQVAQAIELVQRLAAGVTDDRDPDLIEHTVPTLVRQRVFGIALGYEDLNDHDRLRFDPALAGVSGKLSAARKDGAPLAGKSTLNRLEQAPTGDSDRHHKIRHDGEAIESLFGDLFLEAHAAPPEEAAVVGGETAASPYRCQHRRGGAGEGFHLSDPRPWEPEAAGDWQSRTPSRRLQSTVHRDLLPR